MAAKTTSSGASSGEDAHEAGDAKILPDSIARATSILVIGMAGSGKTTFTSCLERFHRENADDDDDGDEAEEGEEKGAPPPYFVNLDPAVSQLHYSPNVDIRDTIDYQRLMEEYNLGPNGGILTALNLFTTKFDQVLGILERRSNDVDHIVLDTPGQIEIFTWSASGTIITDALATAMPTVVAYIIDTPRTLAPATFMSNMLYACSIMYKTKLPFIVVFNKTDVQSHEFALEWMEDFEKFQEALKQTRNPTEPIDPNASSSSSSSDAGRARRTHTDGDDGTYMNSLMNSMALVLDEFYRNLRTVGVSSTTQNGMSDFFDAVQAARQEYIDDYRPELDKVVQERAEKKQKDKKEQLARMMKDMRLSKQQTAGAAADGTSSRPQDEQRDAEMDALAAYEGDGQLLDPDTDEEIAEQDGMFPSTSSGVDARSDGSVWPRQFNDLV